MENKIALITGANRGIGKAIADRFEANGYRVIVLSRTPSENQNHLHYPCDLSDVNSISEVVGRILKEFKKIDVLVNNAGITKDNLVLSMSYEDFLEVMQVNLNSAFYLTKLISRAMLKQRSGKIINISSVVGLHGNAGQANYSASKAGLIGLTKSMAKEFASRNIQVNAICPGFIETDMTAKLPEEYKEQLKEQIPLKRFGEAADIANAAFFLASEEANYITGQVLCVCGGMSI
ncbi:MAG: 3-oxoacyl-[acyl-carrier-protein] reductase [Bacillota bacterium]|nr:3-oxoacyl-[acyl-carrier-protein] reductase [Bacillota bacterium]